MNRLVLPAAVIMSAVTTAMTMTACGTSSAPGQRAQQP
jgi:hypothetical protein